MDNNPIASKNKTDWTPEVVVEKQLETYNAHDLEGYMALFHDDIEIYDHPGVLTMKGAQTVRARYAKIFQDCPENYCQLLHRIVLDERVIDHERVYRHGPQNEGFEMIAVYEVHKGLIVRIDFIRQSD